MQFRLRAMNKLLAWSIYLAFGGSLMAQAGKDSPAAKLAAAAPRGVPLQMVFQLADGSRITGVPAIDHIAMSAQYADVEIPLPRVRFIKFNDDRSVQVNLENGDQLSGHLSTTEVPVKTAAGRIVIPLAQVRQMRAGSGYMPDGCVLHYTFDRNDGDRVPDESGAGNDGKIHGATFTAGGKIFGAMSFSGDGDAVIVGNPASLHLQDFTIMAWIKRGDIDKVAKANEFGEIFGYGAGGYVMGINQESCLYLSQADIHFGSIAPFQIHDKEFHHVAVTKEGSKFVFYLDGAAYPGDDFETEGDFVFNTDAAVGARSDDLSKCFLGVIDEVAVFKRPLSADEVKKVYESQK